MKPVAGNKLPGLKGPTQIPDANDSAGGLTQSALSPELSEPSTAAKYGTFLFSIGLLLIAILVWFILSCRVRGRRGKDHDWDRDYRPRRSNEMQGYGEFEGLPTEDEDDDEAMAHKKR